MCTVLSIDLACDGADRGKVTGCRLHLFAQLELGEDAALVPMARAPAALASAAARRVARLYAA